MSEYLHQLAAEEWTVERDDDSARLCIERQAPESVSLTVAGVYGNESGDKIMQMLNQVAMLPDVVRALLGLKDALAPFVGPTTPPTIREALAEAIKILAELSRERSGPPEPADDGSTAGDVLAEAKTQLKAAQDILSLLIDPARHTEADSARVFFRATETETRIRSLLERMETPS